MPLLNKCCFCCQLQTGGVILGWLGVLSASVSILISLIVIGFLPEFLTFMKVIIVLVNTISLITSICLLNGSMKRQRFLLLPWLISGMASIIIFIIFFFVLVETDENFGGVILTGLFIAFNIYLWLCVYSLFQSIREEEQVKATGNEMVNHITHIYDVNDGLPAYKNLV